MPSTHVSEADVERSLQALARERATLVPVSRPAQFGDVATLDYAGTIDGVAFEGGSAQGQSIELAEGRFVPGFVAGIVGMNPGERKDIAVTFPDDYPAAEVAGKPASFAVALHDLKEFELPTIDDAFAREVSGSQTLDELRADVRRRMEAVATARRRRTIGNAVVEQLLRAHEFPLPPSMVESELDRLAEEAASEGSSRDDLRESLRAQAESAVKTTLLVEQIAKAEKIVATPADIAAELELLARRYGQPAARIRKALGNNVLSLMDGIVRGKTLDLLIDNAQAEEAQETTPPAS